MKTNKALRELFAVKARFCRSVNISMDYANPSATTDYIVTPLTRMVLARVGDSLTTTSKARAWSLTGPYGGGKSACGLFLANVLGHLRNEDAWKALRRADAGLSKKLLRRIPELRNGGFFVVPITGAREPIAVGLLQGIERALSVGPFHGKQIDRLLREARSLSRSAKREEVGFSSMVLKFIERVAKTIGSGKRAVFGLLLILDELGKFLEFAALNHGYSDVFLLQMLAELSSRSDDNPIGIITILHQAFERYAARLRPEHQQEWAKVQGRFEDIAFLEPPDQLLRLIGSAIERRTSSRSVIQAITTEARQASNLLLGPRVKRKRDSVNLFACCAPLHPTVAILLPRLFHSRLAQNERSLFAFLTSGELHGLQEYIRREVWKDSDIPPFYRIDQLYDYVLGAMGWTVYGQAQGRRWAEIEAALERLPKECKTLDARLVKTVGLLGLLGDQRYVKAAGDVLAFSLADGNSVSPADVHRSLRRLTDWGIAIYRRYKGAYALWEGSDIDLEQRFQKGLDQIDRSVSLASLLSTRSGLHPYVAKRHLHKTGTLRYFTPWITGVQHIDAVLERPFGSADGAIVFIIAENGCSPARCVESILEKSRCLSSAHRKLFFFAIPKHVVGIREALDEVLAWEWVAKNTPKLEGDSVARKEVAGRQIEAQERLNRLCRQCFDKSFSYDSCLWVWNGKQRLWSSATELSMAFSEACNRAYCRAPVIHNELVNRRFLSSAAVAARRALIERMLTHGTESQLGIEGFPAELSMYLSVLERSGLHHKKKSRWEFGLSPTYDPCRVRVVWQAIEAFLESTERGKRPVSELFACLREPPYGIKDGLLPIFLVVALLHWKSEVALYEHASFVPEINIAILERLIKSPERLSIRRYRIVGVRSKLFKRYAAIAGRSSTGRRQPTLLGVVRPLLAFAAQLPAYSRTTQSVSPYAKAVCEALVTAREPHTLLFESLPQAVGMRSFGTSPDLTGVESFFAALKKALMELHRSYDALLATIEKQLLGAMRLPSVLATARTEAAQRGAIILDKVADVRLRVFTLRLTNRQLPDREWIEGVAACLTNKPPAQWNDQDLLQYGVNLAEAAGQFRRVEEIVCDATKAPNDLGCVRLLRVGVTEETGQEHREMVRILPADQAIVSELVDALEASLRRKKVSERISVATVAELARRMLGETSHQEDTI